MYVGKALFIPSSGCFFDKILPYVALRKKAFFPLAYINTLYCLNLDLNAREKHYWIKLSLLFLVPPNNFQSAVNYVYP
jgi:hypothetical protein